MKKKLYIALFIISIIVNGCKDDSTIEPDSCFDEDFFSNFQSRTFNMGFSTWAYAPTVASVENTYQFISDNSDIYSEHIDYKIPWNAWSNDLPLPAEFTNEIAGRVARRIQNKKLSVSVSLLNNARNDLAEDFDGNTPNYTALNDIAIENAYFKHLQYIANQFNPDYLILAIEVNELLKNAPEKWEEYKLLMANIKQRIHFEFPTLTISESITLHNLYNVDVANPASYIDEIVNYANSMDLVTISFYPYFKGLQSKEDFQEAFDFLHNKIVKPIAFVETSHLSENLNIEAYNLTIEGNQCEQNEYLESLLTNAQMNNYKFIIWWAHRDYNELWETFPTEVQDIGKLWLSTGIINEDGAEKVAFSSWKNAYNK